MCPVRTNVLVVPPATLAFVHEIVPPAPTAGVLHDQPPGDCSDLKVICPPEGLMPVGRVSLIVTLAAVVVPSLAIWMVKVTSESGTAWSESTVLVTPRSALIPPGIVVTTLASLFSSSGSLGSATLATFVIAVPGLVPESIWTTRVKVETLPALSALFEQVIVPPDPNGGDEHDHDTPESPELFVKETNDVSAGTLSVMLAPLAWSGPLLNTWIV